ncbi:MAG: glycosyltransferase family 4 protein [Rhodospirillaceae bacterium]|nr:glycosyltransferase family 4 protein [Rhodospirillaceae bacterium]
MGTVRKLGIAWQVGVPSGWGTYGLNLALALADRGVAPELFFKAADLQLPEADAARLGSALARQPENYAAFRARAGPFAFPMLHALGDKLDLPAPLQALRGAPDIGVVFFESAVIPPENIDAAKRFAVIVAGSSWNAEVLQRHGLTAVRNCPQGVDLKLFTPAPKQGRFGDKFVVFSGGKLEYRKGQDLVVAAFQRFQAKHTDAVLVTAWHSPWPQAAQSMAMSAHLKQQPGLSADGRLDIAGWAAANRIPPHAIIDLGTLRNVDTPAVLREADVALLPSRCEGGTNLVAMECMASGVPVILSRNTGHTDLMRPDNCYALDLQIPIGAITGRKDLEGWGESSIDEIVMRLEQAYADRDDRLRRGVAAAAFMQTWSWAAQTDRFLAAIADFTP